MSAYLDKKRVLGWVIFFHMIDGYFACFRTRPWNLNLLRSRTLLTLWVPMWDSLNNKHVLSRFFSSPWLLATRLLFSNPSLKFQLDKVEGRCWQVGLGYQIIRKGNVYSIWFILFPVIAAYLNFIFKPTREIWTWYLIRLMESADGWVQNVRLSEKETCVLSGFILFHVIALRFHFQSHP
jgi:hypothetical protein